MSLGGLPNDCVLVEGYSAGRAVLSKGCFAPASAGFFRTWLSRVIQPIVAIVGAADLAARQFLTEFGFDDQVRHAARQRETDDAPTTPQYRSPPARSVSRPIVSTPWKRVDFGACPVAGRRISGCPLT